MNRSNYPELLLYWIKERELIRRRKEAGLPKPWSDDNVFRETYFCNVHREHDRVTRWIRGFYNPHASNPLFVYNLVLARFLNWPSTLEAIGYQETHNPDHIKAVLGRIKDSGQKVWGNAYVITTHGMKMGKIEYLTDFVLEDIFCSMKMLREQTTCRDMSQCLQQVDGIGSFLAAQVVADLKNTPDHPLFMAHDRYYFVEPGPGSVKGASWFAYGIPGRVTERNFKENFDVIRAWVDQNGFHHIDNQDLQNCLCEFDKYCRVSSGVGRSKRGYNGYS